MRLSLALITIIFLCGCATPQVAPIRPEDVAAAPLIAFLQEGTTSRQDVLLELGTPAAQFEGERILTYQLRADSRNEISVFWPRRSEVHPILTDWQRDIFSLVLVFDEAGLLKTYSLVGAR